MYIYIYIYIQCIFKYLNLYTDIHIYIYIETIGHLLCLQGQEENNIYLFKVNHKHTSIFVRSTILVGPFVYQQSHQPMFHISFT